MGISCPTCPTLYAGPMSRESSRTPEFKATRLSVLDRDGWVCTWPTCGKHLEGQDATVDHVVAVATALSMGWSRAQIDDAANLVAMCRKHNGMKSDQVQIRVDYRSPRWFAGSQPNEADRPMAFF